MKVINRQILVNLVKPAAGLAAFAMFLIIVFSFLPSPQAFHHVNNSEFSEIHVHELNLLLSKKPGPESLKQAQELRQTLPGISIELERYHLLCLHNSASMIEFEKYAWAFLMVTDDELIAYLLNQKFLEKGDLQKSQILGEFRPVASTQSLLFYLDHNRFWINFFLWSLFLTVSLIIIWLKFAHLEKATDYLRFANASIRHFARHAFFFNQTFETISPVGLKKLCSNPESAMQKSESILINLNHRAFVEINTDFIESSMLVLAKIDSSLRERESELKLSFKSSQLGDSTETADQDPEENMPLKEVGIELVGRSVFDNAESPQNGGRPREKFAIEDYDPIFTFKNPAIPGYYNFSRFNTLAEAKLLVTETMMNFEKIEKSLSEEAIEVIYEEKKAEEAKLNIVETPAAIDYLNSDPVVLPSIFNAEAMAQPYYQENSPIFENLAAGITNSDAGKVIGITSGSTVSNRAAFTIMLGKSISKNPHKVLLFDLDLDNLKLNQLTRDPCIYSLKDYLKTGVFNDEITIKSLIDNVFILHPGTGDGKSHQAMNSPGFWHEVLRLAGNRFDYIIINLPDLFKLSSLALHKEEIFYLVMLDENSASSRFEFLDLMIPLRNYNFNLFKPVNCRHSR
ncbi:MAG: hypothetical protein AB1403_04485 [Candidatus Riflebacteria bacterium]